MDASIRHWCSRAIAYLKVVVRDDSETFTPAELDAPILRPHGDEFLVAYLVDEGDRFQYVQVGHLRGAGLTEDELHELGLRNLRAFAETNAQVHPYGSIFAVVAGGNFEASLLLLDEFWTEWYGHLVPNGPVAAIPSRDVMAFGDSGSPQALRELRDLCERVRGTEDHPLTQSLVRRERGVWRPVASD
ncbi:MAG: DUF1444 family protein [Planctomycetes bacterium]|nr:DUF1444 family protein [Planctomycetota bacterium]